MTEPRDERRKRKAAKPEGATQAATAVLVSRGSREPRPLLPPLKVGREWEQVRRIAYL